MDVLVNQSVVVLVEVLVDKSMVVVEFNQALVVAVVNKAVVFVAVPDYQLVLSP